MSKYFTEATDKLAEVSYPYEVHDTVFNRMLGYLGYIRMNLAEENEKTLEYLDSLVIKMLAVMQINTLSVTQKIDIYHEIAHELAENHIMLSNGEMPTDNLFYPNAPLL